MKNSSVSSMYLSNKAVSAASVKNTICTVLGGVFTVFFVLSVAMAIANVDGLRDGLIVYVFLLIPSALLWYKGIKGKRLTNRANYYNSIFVCSQDKMIPISELTKQTGKNTPTVIAELEQLLDKGYLCGCTLQRESQPCVILSDGDSIGAEFVVVQCEACGGTTRLRAGSTGKCEYCGRNLKA